MFNSVDEFSILSAQVETLKRKIGNFNASNMYVQNIICDYCGVEHAYLDCLIDNWCCKHVFIRAGTVLTLNGVVTNQVVEI